MPRDGGSTDRLWFWFAVTSVVFLVVLAVSPVKDLFREYRHYQKEYRARSLALAGTSKELRQVAQETVHIRQIWLPGFDNRVDRCVSCHLGTENAKMADAPEPYRLHPVTPHTPGDFERFGCVSCHRGQGRATSRAEAHGDVADWSSPLLPLRYTEASCGICHLDTEVPEASLLSRGRRLMDRAGCFGCHKLRGHESWQSSAPNLDGLAEKTDPEWLRAWLRNPRALRPTTWMPNFHLDDEQIDALIAFLWVQAPLRPLGPGSEADLRPGDFDRGKKLFRESRCISCHTVGGRGNGSAPELGGIGSKVDRRWLIAFIGDPQAFQPRTAMPHYDFTRQDLLDLSEYMMEDFVDPSAPAPGPPYRPAERLVAEGEKLYRKYGCAGCHRIAGRHDPTQIGPELTGVGSMPAARLDFGSRDDLPRRLPDWLAAKVSQPRSFRSGLKMPDFGFDEEQVEAVVTALLSAVEDPVPEGLRVVAPSAHYTPPGRFGALVTTYRCLSCHQIQGVGGDISTAPLTAEGSKVREEWLEQYLLLPTTIRPVLTDRMIVLRMPEEEAAFLANFIENVRLDDTIPAEAFPQGPTPAQIERGERLYYERYGCQACHQIGGNGGYYGPPLDDVPEKLKSGWVAWWLQGPQRWRADVRCPDFGLDPTDATDLTAYLVSLPSQQAVAAAGAGGGR